MLNLVPQKQLGYLSPVYVVDQLTHQFYRLFPKEAMLVAAPLGIPSFTAEGADAALEHFWPMFDFLVERRVDRIVQGGIPVSALAGYACMQRLLEEARKRTSIPVALDFDESIEGLKSLGVRRVAVAAKWDRTLMQAVVDYLREAGVECVGQYGEAHTAQQVLAVRPAEGIELAVHLGRQALEKFPQADGLLLAGGAWLSAPAIPILEAQFGKPVVTNPAATYWSALRQFGMRGTAAGWGRLIDNL